MTTGSLDEEAPDHVGRFKILRRLAQGGMAELFLARADGAVGFAKLVVVKRILEAFSTQEDLVRMFADEARLAGRLEHPNIVQVYDFGEDLGRFFYAMEFVQGENVSTICKRMVQEGAPMPFEVAIAIIAGAASGLHYAHQMTGTDGKPLDVVHRDVSPHNIIVSYDGAVKIVDFGIAKTRAREADPTRAGALKGKLAYMSPEQALCRPLDRRTDIFSLCIIFWELVAGRRLFASETTFATLAAVCEEPILPVSVYRPDVPPALEAIIQRGLSREVGHRFPTALALREALDEVSRELQLASTDLRLTRYMSEHFADRVSPWLHAKQGGEHAIVQHYSDPKMPVGIAPPDDDDDDDDNDDTGAADPTQRTMARVRPMVALPESRTLRAKLTVTPQPELVVEPLLDARSPFPDHPPKTIPERHTNVAPLLLENESDRALFSAAVRRGPPRALVIAAVALLVGGLATLAFTRKPPGVDPPTTSSTELVAAHPIAAPPIAAPPIAAPPARVEPIENTPAVAIVAKPPVKAPAKPAPLPAASLDPRPVQKKKIKRGVKEPRPPMGNQPPRPFDPDAALPL